MPVPIACTMRPKTIKAKPGAIAQVDVPAMNRQIAATNSDFMRKRRSKNAEMGTMHVSTSRYAVVTHCTVAVFTENSSINAGNATFMAVSTTTPANDMMPQATIESTSFASSTRSVSSSNRLAPFSRFPYLRYAKTLRGDKRREGHCKQHKKSRANGTLPHLPGRIAQNARKASAPEPPEPPQPRLWPHEPPDTCRGQSYIPRLSE